MLNCGYFFKETRSKANEGLEAVMNREKIKKARQMRLGEKSFAMQLSVFWGNELVFPQKKPIEQQVFYRLYTSLRG